MGYIGNAPYQGVLTGGNIQDGTVETTDLADGAVATQKLADTAVTAGKLHTTLDLSAKTVTLPDGSVTNAKIASGVDASKLTTGTLPSARLADGSVTDAKIASGVDASKLTTGTLPSARLADGSIATAKLADGSVTAAKLAAGAAVPSQSGQSGKFLTTNGTTASWATVTIPDEVVISSSTPTGVSQGQLWYDTVLDVLKAYTGSQWLKVSAQIPLVSSISGSIFSGVGSTLTLTGVGFIP